MTFKHIDLFSGIGGFAYGAREVWGREYENICFCDNNIFCRSILRKNFGKESLIYDDIREVTGERIFTDTQSKRFDRTVSSWGGRYGFKDENIDILTGGFPCQPFSLAGKRRGADDNRNLWPEMYRIIKDTRPRWVIGENVGGLITIDNGMVFEQVCSNLEGEGYAVQSFIIPACAVNAPHRRERIWIIAHAEHDAGCSEFRDQPGSEVGRSPESHKNTRIRKNYKNASNPAVEGLQEWKGKVSKREGSDEREIVTGRNRISWEISWLEIATELCRVDDGLPAGVDGLKLTKAGHRAQRLKALGNSIVPQVVMEIMRSIKQVDEFKGGL